MSKEPTTWLRLDRAAGDLEGQVYRAFRARILSGSFPPARPAFHPQPGAGAGLARSTVVAGYDRLPPKAICGPRAVRLPAWRAVTCAGGSSAHRPAPSAAVVTPADPARFLPLRPGVPDLDAFPHAVWARCLSARARALRVHDLGYADEQGLPLLREAVLDHVRRTRAVVADPAQVVIVPSTAAALALLANLVLRPGDTAWVEDPGYATAQAQLRAAGATLVPVPVDGEGSIRHARAQGGAALDPCYPIISIPPA
jgi:GntR family transcriptional regulator/MocR family aminotransferase